MKRLQDKVALVTGAGKKMGIGFACALRLAEEGAKVIIADMDIEENKDGDGSVNQLIGELQSHGTEAMAINLNVTDEEAVKKAFASIKERFGKLHILINNAGVAGTPGPLAQTDVEGWKSALEVNLTGTFLCCREAIPMMVEEGGKIVNMSSRAGYRGAIWLHAYSATKAGLIGLTRSMALELAPFNITVNAICPGHIDTEMKRWGWKQESTVRGNSVDDLMKGAAAETPLGRIGTPEDVAATAAFLVSPDSSYITGEVISVTGGDGTRTVL